MSEFNNIPKINLSADSLGKSDKIRTLNLDLKSQEIFRRIGWFKFGKDGSLYFHLKGKSPIVQMGEAAINDGMLVKTKSEDISSITDERKTGTHLSLHPSGEVHVKSHGQEPLVVSNIGEWLPVKTPFTFAYIITEPIENIVTVDKSATQWIINDPSKSIKLDVVIYPVYQKNGKRYFPLYASTVWLGVSPVYSVLINAAELPACESHTFFLAKSIQMPNGKLKR